MLACNQLISLISNASICLIKLLSFNKKKWEGKGICFYYISRNLIDNPAGNIYSDLLVKILSKNNQTLLLCPTD